MGQFTAKDDTIVETGSTRGADRPAPGRRAIGCPAAKWSLPGSICGHTHFYGTFARGMAHPRRAGRPTSWRSSRGCGGGWTGRCCRKTCATAPWCCLVDAIRHGCTTLIDHHASPNAIDGSLDMIAETVKQAGLRASLCYEVTDRNGQDGARGGHPRRMCASSSAVATGTRPATRRLVWAARRPDAQR